MGSPIAGPGQISGHSAQQVYVAGNLVNLGGNKLRSTDITIDHTWKWPAVGRFDFSSARTTFNSSRLQTVPSDPFYQYAGHASTNVGTVTMWRTYSTLDWKNCFVGVIYVSSVVDVASGGDDVVGLEPVASFAAFDLGLSYAFSKVHLGRWLDGLKVTAGVNNLANREPPLAPNTCPDTEADAGFYNGSIGRMYYVSASQSF
jgi:iron complex outermembrane recepter protein